MCVLLFCVCMSDCVSKFVCARVFALMSVYVRLNVFECVPARHVPMCFLCIDVSACDSRVFVHIYVGDVDVGGHSYVCDCFLVCCLCVSLRLYMCTHVCNIHVFCLCVCLSVYTHVCVARMLGTFLRRWEKRGFQCSRLLFHSSSIASLLLAPHAILQTQTQTNIYIMHICNDINTHTHKSKLADFPAMSFYIFHWYSSWNKNLNNTS